MHILVDFLYALTFTVFLWVGVKAVKAWAAGAPASHAVPTLACAALFVALNGHWYFVRPDIPQWTDILWSIWEVLVGFVLGRWIMQAQRCAAIPGWCLVCPRRYSAYVARQMVGEAK